MHKKEAACARSWGPLSPSTGTHWSVLAPLNQWLGATRKLVNSRSLGCYPESLIQKIHVGAELSQALQVIRGRWASKHPHPSPSLPPMTCILWGGLASVSIHPTPWSSLSPPQSEMISVYSIIHHWLSRIISILFVCFAYIGFAFPWKQGPWLIHLHAPYLLNRRVHGTAPGTEGLLQIFWAQGPGTTDYMPAGSSLKWDTPLSSLGSHSQGPAPPVLMLQENLPCILGVAGRLSPTLVLMDSGLEKTDLSWIKEEHRCAFQTLKQVPLDTPTDSLCSECLFCELPA